MSPDSLTQRMADGLGSNKYRAVDYDRLRAELSEKKFRSVTNSMKVAKLEKKSKQHKENSILKQHQLIWQKEFLRLQNLRRKTEAEIEAHVRSSPNSEVCGQIYKDIDYYDSILSSELTEFKKTTSDPVWNLRDDLRFWLMENKEDLKLGSPNVIEKHSEIRSTIDGVKTQQQDILSKLSREQKNLETELQSGELAELCQPPLLNYMKTSVGIPQEAFDLECPDAKLKSDVLGEFVIIDGKYKAMIEDLNQKHPLVLSLDEFGGWDPSDHFKFLAVYDQYQGELPNRRRLLYDCLNRHLPKKSHTSLSEHEDWWMDFTFYHKRLRSIYVDWARCQAELISKAQMVFAEAAVAYELEEVRNEYYHRQKHLCQILYERVKEWREKKMEAMQLEAELNEERQRQMEEKEAKEKEAEKRRRSKEKEDICQYRNAREEERQRREQAAEKRLKELKRQMEEQAVYDRERIKFREEQLSLKLEDQRKKEEEKAKETEEMEARLEALRAQVRVIAESDPMRIIQGTKAWEAHLKQGANEEISMLKPLFAINGYTSQQITSDHRVRLEERLREAGLHTTEYARQIIGRATPPRVPRRDLQHTFRFKEQ